MTSLPQAAPRWKASRYCNNGNCLEVAVLPETLIGVRDSKQADSPVLRFTAEEWDEFVLRLKHV
ncbi:DUF397 domain-containing protein [Nonomuraea roseola]|uniref:DUF397 domain-containing protein n=1 Tax=Nonomuraea roseola TaxID=46179 RepID=A0ABV5PRN8_9ACTN